MFQPSIPGKNETGFQTRLWCVDCKKVAEEECESEAHDTRGLLSYRKRQAEQQLQALEQLEKSLSAVRGLQDQALEQIARAGSEQLEKRVRDCMEGLRAGREPWDSLLQEAEQLLERRAGLDQDVKLVRCQRSLSVRTEDWRAEGLQLDEQPVLRLGLHLLRRQGLLQKQQPAEGQPLEKRVRLPQRVQPPVRSGAPVKVGVGHLPDEMLAHIFSYVATKRLVREMRAVCWRWRNIALHPLAWKHRSTVSPFFRNTTENSVFLARVLQLAPCAASLSLNFKTLRRELALRQMALTTSCATKRLTLHIEARDMPSASKVLLDQAAFGRLRTLKVTFLDFVDEKTTVSLFRILINLNLDSLEIHRPYTPVMTQNAVFDIPNGRSATSSLRCLKLTGSFSNRLLEVFLNTWGSSLESIDARVIDEAADEWTTSWLSKLSGCPNLQSATLPAVVEVASLAECSALTYLHLLIPDEGGSETAFEELTAGIGGFFRRATRLKSLEVSCIGASCRLETRQCAMVMDLVANLASSGTSSLDEFTLLWVAPDAAVHIDELETVLFGLPKLRRLNFGFTPSFHLLNSITPSSAPSLSVLSVIANCNELGGSTCFSNFMIDVVKRNINLHVKIECGDILECPCYKHSIRCTLGMYAHALWEQCPLHDSGGVSWVWVGDT